MSNPVRQQRRPLPPPPNFSPPLQQPLPRFEDELPPLNYLVRGMPELPRDQPIPRNLPPPPNPSRDLNPEALISLPTELMFKILVELDPTSLGRLCAASPTLNRFCESDEFWKYRFVQDFGKLDIKRMYYSRKYSNIDTELETQIRNLLNLHIDIGRPEEERKRVISSVYNRIMDELSTGGNLYANVRLFSPGTIDGLEYVMGSGKDIAKQRMNYLEARAKLLEQINNLYETYLKDLPLSYRFHSIR